MTIGRIGDGEVVLRAVTDESRPDLEALSVPARQRAFVSSVTDSLAEAERFADAHPLTFGVYERDTPVGFVMIADEVDGPDYIPHYLWKLLIDERFQRRGLGTAALDLVAAFFRSKGVATMWTSAGEGDGSPIPFYERYGFVRDSVHEEDDGSREILLRLDLTEGGGPARSPSEGPLRAG
jgi:diamine N-acetyltransferase